MEDWKKPPGRPRITWMKTVLDDFNTHKLTLTEAVQRRSEPATLEAVGYVWYCTLLWYKPEMMMMMMIVR